ncbi:hypothetical protein ACVIHA_002022 [Bradyrhizobium liaoningense]
MTPTTTPALPSSVTPTMATTPEPICFLPSSARALEILHLDAFHGTCHQLDVTDLAHAGRGAVAGRGAAAHRELLAGVGQLALELLALLHQRGDARRHIVEGGTQLVGRGLRQCHGLVGVPARVIAGQRLDAAHARGDRALARQRDQADIAGALHMGAAAELDRPAERVGAAFARGPAHRDDADFVAVFLAEQRACTGLAGLVHAHDPRGDLVVLQHHVVGDVLDAGELLRGDRLRMHEVEAQAVGRDHRAALGDVVAEHLA